MVRKLILFTIVLSSIFLSSCSNLILFTEDVRDNLKDNYLDVKKVQFYNSDKIVLKRNLTKEETQIAKGTIRLKNGEYFEEIVIPKKTKGVATRDGEKFLRIAFEVGENRNLRFTLNENNEYQISADNWKNDYGCVVYDTTKYFIVPNSSNALLLVNKEYISNFEKKRRVLKGRSVGR
ncbi:MAG: hypothetical protein QM503_00725 [Bacteroidota bacterium]